MVSHEMEGMKNIMTHSHACTGARTHTHTHTHTHTYLTGIKRLQ